MNTMCRLMLGFNILAIIVMSGCQSSSTSSENANLTEAREIFTESMAVHDEVMPRLQEIMQLRRAVENRVDSLNQLDSVAYADTVQYMQHIIDNLRYADRGMMQWMRNVKKVPGLEEVQTAYQDEMEVEAVDTANIVQVQRSQKTAIEVVKEQMEQSIAEAKSLIDQP